MSKKNILFILADQLRADFCSCYGADWLKTPNIDNLSNAGVTYSQAISPSPICVPARASLLTGKNALENRVTNNSHWLRPDHNEMGIETWAKKLTDVGYHTVAIGKMHFYPWDINEGFEHRIIAEDKRHIWLEDAYTKYLKQHGYKRLHGKDHDGYFEHLGAIISKIPEEHQIDRFVCNETCSYLNSLDNSRPFAMMVGFPGPHCPYDPAPEVFDRFPCGEPPCAYPVTHVIEPFRKANVEVNTHDWNGIDMEQMTPKKAEKVRKHYSALVQAIDSYIGEIVETLKRKNLYDDTIIIFSADHGDFLGDYGMAGKYYFYESSTHVPLIVKDTLGTVGVQEQAVSLTDIHNTILHFAELETSNTPDCSTLAPFDYTDDRAAVFGCTDLGWMLRNSQYLYTEYQNGTREFYDIKNDKGQQNTLIWDPKYSQQIEQMRKELMYRAFSSIDAGNNDMIARFDSKNPKTGIDPFNHQGWKRPYPHCAK